MTADWVVVIETMGEGSSVMTIDDVRRLMGLMAERNPTTLYSPDRYALQIVVPAPTADQALSRALTTWQDAQERLNFRGWRLVRAEVITEAEFERDVERRGHEIPSFQEPDGGVSEDDPLRQVFHDPTTGLADRILFIDHLRQELLRSQRIDGQLALVMLEIGAIEVPSDIGEEEFRSIVLTTVADRLTQATRGRDSVARVSDTRFAVLLDDVPRGAALEVAGRLLAAVNVPIPIGPHAVTVPVTLGVSTSDRGDTAQSLILDAELALHWGDRTGSTVT